MVDTIIFNLTWLGVHKEISAFYSQPLPLWLAQRASFVARFPVSSGARPARCHLYSSVEFSTETETKVDGLHIVQATAVSYTTPSIRVQPHTKLSHYLPDLHPIFLSY